MSTGYPPYRRRGAVIRGIDFIDDFMNWVLYGHETWLVAVIKGVPLFLYVYFLLTYVPNYVYYLVTVELPFLRFSDDVGFLIANGIGFGNFAIILVLAFWTQAARGRQGFGWWLVRLLNFLQLLFVMLLLIPLMAFNLAGGSFIPARFPLQSLAFGTIVAGMGAAGLAYLYLEFRRITRREAEDAAARSAAYSRAG